MNRWWPALFFAACVVLHVWIAVAFGNPFPGGRFADSNVYLELAQNIWRHGTYGSRVSVDYPPMYPLLISPTTALTSNSARFAWIHGGQAFLISLASLSLLPMVTASAGRTRAWVGLGLIQLLGGLTLYAWAAQTETLFTAILVATTGVAWMAWDRPERTGRWIALGALSALAVSTRRMGLVVPIAVGMLWTLDLIAARRSGEPLPWRRAGALLGGGLLGALPEALAMLAHGEILQPYGGKPTTGHLKAGVRAFDSLDNLFLAVAVGGRHVAWATWATAGAPIVAGLLLLRRTEAPLALRRTCGFALLLVAGLIGMTTLHIIRFKYGNPEHPGWDLYPRYIDPAEPVLVATAFAAAAWLFGPGGLGERARSIGAVGAMTGIAALGALVGGGMNRARGGRFPDAAAIEAMGWPSGQGSYAFLFASLFALALWLLWWWKGRPGTLGAVALALVFSWTTSSVSLSRRVGKEHDLPREAVLRLAPLMENPTAPLGVLVRRPGHHARHTYEPAFRSDHPVEWLRPGEAVETWAAEHPDGYLLLYRKDLKRGVKPPGDRPVLANSSRWVIYRAATDAR